MSRIPTKIRSPPKAEENLLNLPKPAVNSYTPAVIRSPESIFIINPPVFSLTLKPFIMDDFYFRSPPSSFRFFSGVPNRDNGNRSHAPNYV